MRFSYSALAAFRQCPAKYKFREIDRVRVSLRPELYFGICIHNILQFCLKNDPNIPSLNAVISQYDQSWEPKVFPDQTTARNYYNLGLEIIKNFLRTHKPGLTSIIELEKFFTLPYEDHTLSGKIDRIDQLPFGGIEIIDYKTSKTLPTQPEIDNDLQLGIYHLAANYLWPRLTPIRLSLYFLRHNKKITISRTPEQIDNLRFEIMKTVDSIRSSDFLPRANNLCPWCEYRHICPLQKDNHLSGESSDLPF